MYQCYLKHHCGWYTVVPFGDVYHVHQVACSRCGTYVPDRNSDADKDGWELFVGQLTSVRTRPFKWWIPATWGATETKLVPREETE